MLKEEDIARPLSYYQRMNKDIRLYTTAWDTELRLLAMHKQCLLNPLEENYFWMCYLSV